ncbi:MAG: DUF4305 domain-containing protein [Alkalibacterium sp.]|uniref:DUF4305 domain-containing protein n=1 Tax=Alkalibacterium sp. TaxID=1872447 RepID=UPI003970F21A
MTEKQLRFQIVFKFLFFALFLFFTIDSVSSNGWGFFSYLFAIFATKDFVNGIHLSNAYYRIKKSQK